MAQSKINKIAVAVGIIQDRQGRFLITQRSQSQQHPNKWEFPGGKIENESAEQALRRELNEELGINVTTTTLLGTFSYKYEFETINFTIFKVLDYSGTPKCHEQQQDMLWADYDELHDYHFPKANKLIIEMLSKELVQ